ncbi:Kell blood group glycoprotein [Folsomia candida]|uniref:Kell blood group glycoprotein n=1 Tax=Folsomia candida TaxID=158441 RepID=A0A226DLU8_FOLCA|nr:Kell blood group glycoprotein [Folsomia candida]
MAKVLNWQKRAFSPSETIRSSPLRFSPVLLYTRVAPEAGVRTPSPEFSYLCDRKFCVLRPPYSGLRPAVRTPASAYSGLRVLRPPEKAAYSGLRRPEYVLQARRTPIYGLQMLNYSFIHYSFNKLLTNAFIHFETISNASEISNRVLQTVKQSVKSASDWSPTQISMNTRIGFGSDALLDPNYLNDLYSYLPLDSNDLLGNLEKVDKFNNFLESVPALGNTITAAKQTLLANASYYPVNDMVVISPGFVHMPRFHPGFWDVFKYSKLGVTVGHELGHAVIAYVMRGKCLIKKR